MTRLKPNLELDQQNRIEGAQGSPILVHREIGSMVRKEVVTVGVLHNVTPKVDGCVWEYCSERQTQLGKDNEFNSHVSDDPAAVQCTSHGKAIYNILHRV